MPQTKEEEKTASPKRAEQIREFEEAFDAYSEIMDRVFLEGDASQDNLDSLAKAREAVWDRLRSPLVK